MFSQPHRDEVSLQVIHIIKDDKLYILEYSAEKSRFNAYLPTINRMLNSLIITPNLPYESFDTGMRMKYPSAWNFTEGDGYFDPIDKVSTKVDFYPVKNSTSELFNNFVNDFEVLVSPQYEGDSIIKDINATLNYYETLNLDNFKLINSSLSSLKSIQPSYNVTFSYGDPDVGIVVSTNIISFQNDRLYSFPYSVPRENYSKSAHVANQVIDSIEFFLPIPFFDRSSGLMLQYPSDIKISRQKRIEALLFLYLKVKSQNPMLPN